VVPVPFAGFSQALNALIGGHVDLMFAPRDVVEAQLAGQRIVPLACAGAVAPQGPLSHLPLLKDTWPGFAVEGWVGVLVPSGTPPEKVSQLNREFNRVLEDPQVHHMLASWGPPPLHNAPEKLARSLAEKTEYYRRLAAEIGLSPP
jgi:tripartite-type tricarboxylate transporter receptor subunit TctC